MRNLVLTDGTVSASVGTDGGDSPVNDNNFCMSKKSVIQYYQCFRSRINADPANLSTITNKTCKLLHLQGFLLESGSLVKMTKLILRCQAGYKY